MIPILFEDEYLILVNKPAMVLSQPSLDKKRVPIQQIVEDQRADLKGKLFLHHRLDFETSGVFLMSKAQEINKNLTEMFKKHEFEKIYFCLTRPNNLAPAKKVTCDQINENEWNIRNYMAPAKGLGGNKKRMISVSSGGWAAETHFEILSKNKAFHCVRARPKTGRTHQIRQHLQESSRSILGDNIYGGKSTQVPRLMLHAHSLEFLHPKTKAPTIIVAPVPKDFDAFVGGLIL